MSHTYNDPLRAAFLGDTSLPDSGAEKGRTTFQLGLEVGIGLAVGLVIVFHEPLLGLAHFYLELLISLCT